MGDFDRARLAELMERERARFVETHPRSQELFERGRRSLLGGVPMGWMTWWASPFPIVVDAARGARVEDVDGHAYVDFCLGEGAAMSGHSPAPVVAALQRQAERGLTTLLPSDAAAWVGEELARRFSMPDSRWHLALSATDANRFALRLAREITGRQRLVVFRGYYHGTLDDAPGDWEPWDGTWDVGRGTWEGDEAAGDPAPASHPTSHIPCPTVTVVEFNDLDALEAALFAEDVACVMLEPALTNVGIVLPDSEYHESLRELTRRTGTLLIVDESHTISAGQGGCTAAWDLEPDVLTVGKTIGGGIATAAYGFSPAMADEIERRGLVYASGTGGTVAGNPLALAAMRANLESVLTDASYAAMFALTERLERGLLELFRERGLPWSTTRLGCRLDYGFRPGSPRSATTARAALDEELSTFLRLFEINRGVLLAPFLGNMLLLCPATTAADVDRYVAVLAEALDELGSFAP